MRIPFLRFFQIALAILSFLLIERFCHQKTGGFQITKITSDHPFNPRWETPAPSDTELEKTKALLNQRYTFFGYGGQAYVFLSEDGNTVLKLFKHHHLRFPSWVKKIPLPRTLNRVRNKWVHRKNEKFELFFDSCKIAHDDFKEQTGLIYLHLNRTDYLKQHMTIIDKLGIEHSIDLDQIDFALQHRARLTKKHFKNLKKNQAEEMAKASIDSLLNMMVERSIKGIADRDPNLRRNCGFIGTKAVEIDLGSYTRNETLKIPFIGKTDIYQKSLQLKKMVSKRYPELSPYLEKRLQEILYSQETATPSL